MYRHTKLKINTLGYLTLSFIILFLISITILALNTNFLADDFRFLSKDFPILNFIYNKDSGRISHALIMVIVKTFFSSNSIVAFPIIVSVALIVSFGFLFFSIKRSPNNFLYGMIAGVLYIIFCHSPFDLLFFFSASTTHTMSIVYLLLLSSFLVWRKNGIKFNKYHYIIIFTLILLSGTFSELASVLGAGTSTLFIALEVIHNYKRKLSKQNIREYLYIIVVNLLSFIIIYTSPGSTSRRLNNISDFSLFSILKGAFRDYSNMIIHGLSINNIFIIVSIGIILYFSFNKILKKINPIETILIELFFIICPLIIFATTNYSLGYTALRLYNIADIFFLLAVSLPISIFISRLDLLNDNKNKILQYILLILMAIISVFNFNSFREIYAVQSLRSNQLKERESIIAEDINSDTDTIRFLPAPLLTNKSEAIDITFYPEESPNSTWLYYDLMNYYGIDISESDVIILEQNQEYCVNETIYSRFKEVLAKECGKY